MYLVEKYSKRHILFVDLRRDSEKDGYLRVETKNSIQNTISLIIATGKAVNNEYI